VWNHLLPGIVSVGISVCVFLYGWVADLAERQRIENMDPAQIDLHADGETVEEAGPDCRADGPAVQSFLVDVALRQA
jgi:hypothetical protein